MQHQIELPHLSMLLVEVPEGAHSFDVNNDPPFPSWIDYSEGLGEPRKMDIPSSSWQLLGTTPLSEEQAAKVVGEHNGLHEYPDYEKNGLCMLSTALESFHSLLTANNIASTKRWAVLYQLKK